LIVDVPLAGPGALIELRYRPLLRSAALFVRGQHVSEGYTGHHQFQDPVEGGVSWAVSAVGNGDARASCSYSLVWLEIF
jgi:hypothetical protein